ncbi:Mitochondrial import inner membrane translocase subunit TIM8 [Grifola frondosa]|uniref:Mitochondrial import inner membrane translocase subunit n=1 Tax=Grifola frondosa TaxID=5627 RepID=A0A1C7MRR3_GRIFR|nr:Mitochondrial import inner membrane translocase subunit TIM8 [Grifola frondosa]
MADKFDEATQKELQNFMETEQAQARVHQSIHSLTSVCWDKCVTGTPGARFSRGRRAASPTVSTASWILACSW